MISGYWENPTMNNADVLTVVTYRIKFDTRHSCSVSMLSLSNPGPHGY